jgi:hypothetical protein
MKKLVLALAVGVSAMGTAHAQWYNQPLNPSRYYAGLAAASSPTTFKLPGVGEVGDTDWETSWKGFIGVEYDPFFGAEIGYIDTRTDDYDYSLGGVNGRLGSRGYGAYLAGKVRYPIPMFPQAEVFGKLGVQYSHRRLNSGGPYTQGVTDDNTGPYAGVGAQWNFNPQWGVVAEYERYGRSKNIGAGADVLTVGVRFNFF